MFKGVNINKMDGLLGNSNPSTDGVMLLVYAIATANKPATVDFYSPYKLSQMTELEELGFNVAFDANNKYLIHQQVGEFFRLAPDATLYLCVVPDTLATAKAVMENVDVQAAIRNSAAVKGVAIAGTTDTFISAFGIVEDVQAVVDMFAGEKRLIDFVLIQGNGALDGTDLYNLSAYPDYRSKEAPNVAISIAQDKDVAGSDVAYKLYADVGSVLGMIAVRQVNENAGSVNIINKPDAAKGKENYPLGVKKQWQNVGLSDGRAFASLTFTDQGNLNAKAYMYPGSFNGYPGVYLNGAPTCVEAASDYGYIENNRTWNKAARLIRTALLPLVRGVVKKDPATGYIRSTVISEWEGRVNKALEDMMINEEISGYSVFIDPKQLPTEHSPVQVQAVVVKDGIVHEFTVDLGLSNSI